MGELTTITAADGHRLSAYVAEPHGAPTGAVVVLQEIFGLTPWIRRVVDAQAADGYRAVAPALFDRVERDVVLGYGDVQAGRAFMQKLEWPNTLADAAAAAALATAGDPGTPAAVVGYCWGGTVAHVAAATLQLAAAVAYYGSGVARMLDRRPRCPVMYHFGASDHAIPLADVDAVRRALPKAAVHVYDGAGHGFACEDRPSYDADSAALADERTRAFLRAAFAQL
jgi:carboxymethylenebutenolidase